MFADISKPAPPLPQPQLKEVQPGIHLLEPLSRRGHGPGLIVLMPDSNAQLAITEGVPWPLYKWAEEGFSVVEIQASSLRSFGHDAVALAMKALKECDSCDWNDKVGAIVYTPQLWNILAPLISNFPDIIGVAIYGDTNTKTNLAVAHIPALHHLSGHNQTPIERTASLTKYYYPRTKSHRFATPFQSDFHYSSESVSHTRNLQFLKPLMDGPCFDLEMIWDEHTFYEFADRSVEHTMSTMVQEPYVNHVPTLTGGIGRKDLANFYRDHFIFHNSADTELELISRTVGIDRVIDEFIFKFTHDREIDWLLPGVPPTGRKGEIPFTAVVNIRGDRLYHEHISWDQGTVLRQLGLLPEYLPFPYPLQEGSFSGPEKTVEYKVPVLGLETVEKMREKTSVPSNELFSCKIREVQ
ncbi:hypothetical protein ACHAQJ_009934 [Trichoderma viride]